MKPTSVARPRLGLAGVIYLSGSSEPRPNDQSWLRSSFEETGAVRRTEWQSEDVFAISQEHVNDVGGQPGSFARAVPEAHGHQGIARVQAFPARANDDTIDVASMGMLEDFKAKGLSSLAGLNGAWTGFIWNRASQRACFVRDAVGAQTMYVGRAGDRIVFSTDLRVFLFSGLFDGLNEQALIEFLHYLYVPAPLTLMPQVRAVLPGHALWVPDGLRQERFAPSRFIGGSRSLRPEQVEGAVAEALPAFTKHFVQAVADCVPPSGRVALALSGGKDSSAIAIALSEICPDRVLAFTVGAATQKYSETEDAEVVSKALGLDWFSYLPTNRELADGLPHFHSLQGQPVGDIAAFPYFLAMKQLPDDCTVVFDGTGNDYYFGIPGVAKGQHIFGRRARLQRRLPSFVWSMLLRLMALGPQSMRDLLNDHWSKPIEESFVPWQGWSSEELERLCGHGVSFSETYLWKVMHSRPPSEWVGLLTDFVCHVLEPHAPFRKATDFAEGLGKFVRFPFIDLRLANYVNSLPVELRYSGTLNKVLLRAYLATRLPEQILTKPKSPFIFELNRVLRNPEYPWLEDLQRRGTCELLPGWNGTPVQDVLQRFEADPSNHRWQQRAYAFALASSIIGVDHGRTLA